MSLTSTSRASTSSAGTSTATGAGRGRSGSGRRRVDIVSGSFGAGHDAAAHEIAARLEAAGYATRTSDIVDLMPGRLGRTLRAGYLHQIRSLPASWSWTLRQLEHHPGAVRGVERALGAAHPGLLALAGDGPSLIVSTHPFASQALGGLRAAGLLDVPVTTYLTDMSVHPLWVHPGVDLHLALHEIPAGEARRRGARETRVVRPAVPDVFSGAVTAPADVRRRLGLPASDPLVLVVGGSCGVGALARTAREVASTGLAVPVVACGRNDRLQRRVVAGGYAFALGWHDDMPGLLGAVDVVVQNAGGFTSLEALRAGVPVVTYRCIAGHGETNARALDDAGLVPWVQSRRELASLLADLLAAGRSGRAPAQWAARPDVVGAIESFVGARSTGG